MAERDTAERVAELLAPFPRERTWLLPALREVQHALGHLPDAALTAVSAHLRVPASEVWGVATGYPELRLTPRGRHHVRVCTGVSCALLGGAALLDAVSKRYGVEPGATGAGLEVSVEAADCFFQCSMAPLIDVDGACHGRAEPGDVGRLERWFATGHPSDISPAHALPAAALRTPPLPPSAPPSPAVPSAPLTAPARPAAAPPLSVQPEPSQPASSLPLPSQPAPSQTPPVLPAAAQPGAPLVAAPLAPAPSSILPPSTGGDPRLRGDSAETYLAALVAAAEQRQRALPSTWLIVHAGTCGLSAGAADLVGALRDAVSARRLGARVVAGACAGACYAAPSLEIRRPGWPRTLLERMDPAAAPALVDALSQEPLAPGRTAAPSAAASGTQSSDPRRRMAPAEHPASVAPSAAHWRDPRATALPGAGVVWTEPGATEGAPSARDVPWRGLAPALDHPFWAGQQRVLLARAGAIDPEDLDDALLHGAYRSLATALAGPPEGVIETVRAAGLLGRGGAFFPTASKWQACRAAAGTPKYVVVNGEEGEPGIFKDRHLMEGDPHQLIEGALLAAYATGASRVVLFVHGEADLAAERLATAVAQAAAAGIVGPRMLGHGPPCGVELRRGAGGFVLGEETALLESIEGRRAQPRTRPPFPVESGLWGKPTVINNVETLSAVPSIVGRGGAWFAGLGTATSPGTKVFGLSGPIARPGVVEGAGGVTLGALLAGVGGGLAGGGALMGAVVGGPSGSVVPAALFDVAMEPRGRVSPGTGGIVGLPAGADVGGVVRTLLAFNARESCGKCTPCREGAPRLLAMVDALAAGKPTAASARELAEAIQLASLCGLGQAAPTALVRALDQFPEAFRR